METRAYKTDNTLSGISFTGAAIGNLSCGWDANKNKTSETITGTMSNYGFDVGVSGYDDEDRLVNWSRDDSNLDQSWNLSLVGDWTSYTENASVQSRTHGSAHELLTVASQSVSHDAKGNMTSIPAVLRPGSNALAMSWDFDNRLSLADTDGDGMADVQYKFDALGRRVYRDDGTAATVYVQNGQQTVVDYTSGAAATSPTYCYLYASYIDEPVVRIGHTGGGKHFYHRNQQYSVIALTNHTGSVKERYSYDAYGSVSIFDGGGVSRSSSQLSNRYTYTGREWDEDLDLYHYRARMYDPKSGRFCSRDPIGFIDGTSLYGLYISLAHTDPFGNAVEYPDHAWDLPKDFEIPAGHTVVRWCARPIDITLGFGGHVYIVVQTENGQYLDFTTGKGAAEEGCDLKGKQLLASLLPYAGPNPVVPGNGPKQSPANKHHCTVMVVPKPDTALVSCLMEVTKRVNECCIPYDPRPKKGVDGSTGCNSNCVASWLGSMCLKVSRVPNGGLQGNGKPPGFKPHTPGLTSTPPGCLGTKIVPRPKDVGAAKELCEAHDGQ